MLESSMRLLVRYLIGGVGNAGKGEAENLGASGCGAGPRSVQTDVSMMRHPGSWVQFDFTYRYRRALLTLVAQQSISCLVHL
jgi:hypothetical protein